MARMEKIWEYLLKIKQGSSDEVPTTLSRDDAMALLVADAPNLNDAVIAEGLPEELTLLSELAELSDRVETYCGVPEAAQGDAVRKGYWRTAGAAAVGSAAATTIPLLEARELVSDAGYLLKGEGVSLSGVDIEGALQRMDDACPEDALSVQGSVVPKDVLYEGLSFLGDLAPIDAILQSLQVAAERRKQTAPSPVEVLVDEMDGDLDTRYSELELRGDQGLEGALTSRKSCRPLSDEELEVHERVSLNTTFPRRTRMIPFSGSLELGGNIMLDVMRCWYAKTLEEASPTVVDELISNLRPPRKSEGSDVGDPLGVVAEVAFALHARLGPSMPQFGPAAMAALWLCTMEGADVDRMLKFNDTPGTLDEHTESDAGSLAPSAVADEYAKKFAGRRNPSILHEINMAMRGVKEALDLPTTALMVVVEKLEGMNNTYHGDLVAVEALIKGQAAQRTELLAHSHQLDYNHTVFFPLTTASVSIRFSVLLEDGVSIGSVDVKYPFESGTTQVLMVASSEQRAGSKAQAIIASLTISVTTNTLDAQTMMDLIETLGGDIHRLKAREKLSRWVKTCCMLQALSEPLDAGTVRDVPTTSAIAQQHSALQSGTSYVALAPAATSLDESLNRATTGSSVKFKAASSSGVDASALSFYPVEKTFLQAPFSAFKLDNVASGGSAEMPAPTLSLSRTTLLEDSLTVAAALRRFFQACKLDLERADKQLEEAHFRVMSERHRNIIHLVQDGDLRVTVREEERDRLPQLVLAEPFPDFLFERLVDRMTPLPDGVEVSCLPPSSTPLAWCTSRSTVPYLLSELILLWYDKEGDVVDELMENLHLPSEATALGTLAQVASVLADVHSDETKNWAEIMVCVILCLEGAEMDATFLADGTPPTFSTAEARQDYINSVGTSRNTSVLPVLSAALAAMADYQLAASLAVQNASTVRKAALTEPHRAQKDIVRKWVKTLGMIIHLCQDQEGTLYRCSTPAPGETDRVLSLETGPWCMWAAPSRAQSTPYEVVGARESALKVNCVIKGLKHALDLTSFQRRHRPGDVSPAVLLPPLTAFLVGERTLSDNNLSVELLTRDCMPAKHPAVLRWREAIARSSHRADQRLRDAFYDMGVAKHEQMLKRHEVTMGKKVFLPEVFTVHSMLEDLKQYRLLIKDEVLPSHCNRASVGVVGNVTDAVTTDIPDLRRNLLHLAAEMRGDDVEEFQEDESAKPQVVSVRFPDDSLYVFPMDLLQVHPISWMPEVPGRLRVTIRWAELHDTVRPPRVRSEIEGIEGMYTTAEASKEPPPEKVVEQKSDASSERSTGSTVQEDFSVQPKVGRGEDPCVPIWEEAYEVELDKLRLSEAPLTITLGLFTEPDEEGFDEYDYDPGEDHIAEDETVLAAVSLAVSHFILLETVGNPRTFPLPLAHPGDNHTADARTAAVSTYVPPTHGKGLLYVSLELLPDDVEEVVSSAEPTPTRAADPLSWRAGEFASDRICTGCDLGGDDCVEAVYVCVHCDEKLCEDCWDSVHAVQSRREDHARLLLYHHCDFCFVDAEVNETDDEPGPPAIWRCETCALNLCKNCWYAEHKHPLRREHDNERIFLYPGGEDGEWTHSTELSQTVTCCNERFHSDAVTWRPQGMHICEACLMQDAVYSWPKVYAEGIGETPLLLCNDCMLRQNQDLENDAIDAELAGVVRTHRPALTLLLERCELCNGLEGRPAQQRCQECALSLCTFCWKAQHRHPLRRGHDTIDLTPPMCLVRDSEAHRLFAEVHEVTADMQAVSTIGPPALIQRTPRIAGLVWDADLRNQEAAMRRAAQLAAEEAAGPQRDASDPFVVHDGYIGSGGDMGKPERLTIAEAKTKCLSLPHCMGFTLQETPANVARPENEGTLYKVLFKEKFNVHGRGKGWCAYEKIQEAGLCKHGVLQHFCERCQTDARAEQLRQIAAAAPTKTPTAEAHTEPSLFSQAPIQALGEPIKEYLNALILEATADV